jgi:hypothetical protein
MGGWGRDVGGGAGGTEEGEHCQGSEELPHDVPFVFRLKRSEGDTIAGRLRRAQASQTVGELARRVDILVVQILVHLGETLARGAARRRAEADAIATAFVVGLGPHRRAT